MIVVPSPAETARPTLTWTQNENESVTGDQHILQLVNVQNTLIHTNHLSVVLIGWRGVLGDLFL
jgi:hypothetical protein